MANLQRKTAQKTAVPDKSTINLAMKETHKTTVLTLVIGIAAIAVLALLVAKYGVIDQQARLQAAESNYNQIHEKNAEVKEYIANYPAVLREYRSVSRAWMETKDGEEVVKVDRQAVLDIVENEMRTRGVVKSVQINDNTLVSSMSGMTLNEISTMFEAIEKYPIVFMTALNSAKTDEKQPGDILSDFSITVYLQSEEGR